MTAFAHLLSLHPGLAWRRAWRWLRHLAEVLFARSVISQPATRNESGRSSETENSLFEESTTDAVSKNLFIDEQAVAAGQSTVSQVEPRQSAFAGEAILGSSREMRNVCKEIGRLAQRPVTVLICGETGTGKELVARTLHRHSDRAGQPFIEVACVGLTDETFASNLFGHEAGAFPGARTRRVGCFEQANHGTIFLDEVGELSPQAQAGLLGVLERRAIRRCGGSDDIPIDVRVIAVTQHNLAEAVAEGRFREDLYHRLNDAVITIPPLRERSEDVLSW